MKRLQTLLVVLTLMVGINFTATAKAKEKKTVTYDVSLHCHECVDKVQKNMAFEKGVKDMKIDLENKQVTLTYFPEKTDDAKLIKAFEDLGFKASVTKSCCSSKKESHKGCSSECSSKSKTDCSSKCSSK